MRTASWELTALLRVLRSRPGFPQSKLLCDRLLALDYLSFSFVLRVSIGYHHDSLHQKMDGFSRGERIASLGRRVCRSIHS